MGVVFHCHWFLHCSITPFLGTNEMRVMSEENKEKGAFKVKVKVPRVTRNKPSKGVKLNHPKLPTEEYRKAYEEAFGLKEYTYEARMKLIKTFKREIFEVMESARKEELPYTFVDDFGKWGYFLSVTVFIPFHGKDTAKIINELVLQRHDEG